jgi:hypothetical protein
VSIATKAFQADSLTASARGVSLRVGLPWYRSLPWAGVTSIALEIDGVDAGEPIAVDGTAVGELPSREDYWSIQRWATIQFPPMDAARPGSEVTARVRIDLRVPGPLLPDGSPMPFLFDETRDVVIGAARIDND